MQILMSVMMATFMMVMVPRAGVSAGRINEVLHTPSTVVSAPAAVRELGRRARLEVRHAGFRYPGADEPVLADITFTAEAGQTTAVIGSTGAGKTTLVSLVARLFDVTAGSVLVDDVDIRELDLELLWSRIGLVPPEALPLLGDGGVQPAPRRSRGDRRGAVDGAVGRPGQGVRHRHAGRVGRPDQPGGRQRLGGPAPAAGDRPGPGPAAGDLPLRRLLLGPGQGHRRAGAGCVAEHTAGATVVIVGQRVSSIRDADQILVLEGGVQVGLGTHADLLVSCPTYQEIVESQHEEGVA